MTQQRLHRVRNFRNPIALACGLALCLGMASSLAAQPTTTWTQQLEPARSADFVPRALIARSEAPPLTLSQEPVRIDHRLAPDLEIVSEPTAVRVTSRRTLREVDADDLRKGIRLDLTSSQPFVWISPGMAEQLAGQGEALALDPTHLVVRTAAGELDSRRAFAHSANAEEIGAVGIFPPGTMMVQLSRAADGDSVEIAYPTDPGSSATYQVHVEEGQEAVALELTTGRLEHFHGDTLRVLAVARDASGQTLVLDQLEGAVITSEEDEVPLTFHREPDGSWSARHTLDALQVEEPGPWTVRLRALGTTATGQPFERWATTAFGVAVPTATLAGGVTVASGDVSADVVFDVDVASEGRYAVQGLVYGTDPTTGELLPAARFESAAWLTPGDGTSPQASLAANIDFCHLANLAPPFEIHDLRLIDQSRMTVVHRRAVALRLADL